ncbi:ABC transporter substrate-binding protein [Paenibacillus turpanensis]|uniref:ABC transporter substrate-binding protein n=1 Tax=Paenibacillus turpanensis TaxID=2689078 RepID=UPI00140D602A|nr:extracellular solute-binding protein [Paenibacillus turpanensis]
MTKWKQWVKPASAGLIALTMLAPTLAACSKQSEAADNTPRTLRIVTTMGGGPDDEWFRQQYTEIFEYANPNITLEIIPAVDYSQYRYQTDEKREKMPDPIESMKEMMNGPNPPDLVITDYGALSPLIADNMLQPLDSLIAEDKFDTSDMVPAVMDGIKNLSTDKKLYALSPTFSSSALAYNKTLFEEAGVPFPEDNMTWDEVFELARRLSLPKGEEFQYGFSFTNYAGSSGMWESNIYTQPLQLRIFDEKAEKMTVDSDAWENVWKKMLDLRTQKVIPSAEDAQERERKMMESGRYNPFEHEVFLSGKVAMTIIDYSYINQIIQANKSAENIENFNPINWDVVTVPTHPEYPGVGGYVNMHSIMAINAKAQNQADAWKFIKFINGEDWARTKAKSSYQLVSRQKYIQPKDGLNYNVKAFTQLTPVQEMYDADRKLYMEYPNLHMVQSIGDQKYREVMEGKKGVREALKEWQTEGDAMLQQIRENPEGPINMPGDSPMAVPAG